MHGPTRSGNEERLEGEARLCMEEVPGSRAASSVLVHHALPPCICVPPSTGATPSLNYVLCLIYDPSAF